MHATRAALCWHVSSELCETKTWSNATEKYLLIDTCILRDKGHTIPYVRGRKHCAIFFFLIVITRPYSPKSIQLLFKALLFVDHTHIFYSIYFWFHNICQKIISLLKQMHASEWTGISLRWIPWHSPPEQTEDGEIFLARFVVPSFSLSSNENLMIYSRRNDCPCILYTRVYLYVLRSFMWFDCDEYLMHCLKADRNHLVKEERISILYV